MDKTLQISHFRFWGFMTTTTPKTPTTPAGANDQPGSVQPAGSAGYTCEQAGIPYPDYKGLPLTATGSTDNAAPGSVNPAASAFSVLTSIAHAATIVGIGTLIADEMTACALAWNIATIALWARGLTTERNGRSPNDKS